MFTNILYRYCCVNIFIFFIFINIECSLLSRVKSPMEHLPEATPDYVLPKNIYRYEPYRGHKTLWAPTHTSGPTTQDSRTLLRTRPPINKPQNYKETPRQETSTTTKRHFWHHFDDAAEEWPKVILITTSTPRLTSKVTRKKTFSTYFPQLRLLPIDENETEIKDADNDDDQNYVIGSDKSTMKDKEKSMPDNEVEEMAEDYDDIQLSSVTKGANTRTYAYLRNSSVETTKLLQTTIRETTTLATTTQPEPTELKNEEKIEQNTQSGTQSEELEPRNENLPNGKNRKCYQCGLNLTGIPHEPTCHQIFDTTKRRYQYLKSQLKVVCTGPMWRRRSNRIKRAPSYDVSPRKLYKGGCFMRFLDVGEVYDERGCRTMLPLPGKSYASQRFTALEKSMHNMTDGCVTSPQASLTPFSRSISLYARYHVCVCTTDYCNNTHYCKKSLFLLIINIFTNIFLNK